MKKAWIRSSLFNLAFFAVTAALSILYIPALLLPRQMFVTLVRFWLKIVLALEYGVLGLKCKVTGLENLPKDGAYIIAAKHQSAYETMKLHLIFDDPAVVLKKELLWIPLFGAYLKKSGAIAIDRSTPEMALRSVQAGVLKVKEEGRPIVIFPQGTRVAPDATTEEKPYKPGIVRIQDVTQLPVIPVALNSGLFWPRNSWFKSSGTVTIQILRPVMPGKERQALMSELEEKIEGATSALVAEARAPRHAAASRRDLLKKIVIALMVVVACGLYAKWWKAVAADITRQYAELHPGAATTPLITGFPGPMTIRLPEETLQTADGVMTVKNVYIHGFPLPLAPITVTTGDITISSFRWAAPLTLQGIEAYVSYWNHRITIKDSLLKKDDFQASAAGAVTLKDKAPPEFNIVVRFKNHEGFLNILAQDGIIDQQAALFMGAGFSALAAADGIVSVPVTQRGRTLYAGPFAFAELPDMQAASTVALPSAATDTPPAPSP